ncbi:MAG: cytochrome C [Alphaproteobacteria bacterium HGW-Alphaproteobacteria-4]|nr:MAG: cytochrome C [Alphaproteobacteria bacterium HGW-Alphaproteobacteria-4]
MRNLFTAAAAVLACATPVLADGDIETGKKSFNLCKACHSVITPAGEALVKGGKVGPNLYGIIGQQVASVADYALYGDGIKAVGATGMVWTADELEDYMTDPNIWIKAKAGNPDAKSKMTGKTAKDQDDIIAYLQSLMP